jgi:homoserine dehydrogenase
MSNSVVNVAVIGVGLVGKEFLNQLGTVASNSPNKTIRLVYVSNSTKSVYDIENSIRLDAWAGALSQSSGLSLSPSDLPERLKQDLSASKSLGEVTVVVDNTSSDKIAALYPSFLRNGIDVITPNKKAYSSSLTLYGDIIASSSGPEGGRFLNESTVGAGLPIISTLKDLVATGDEVSRNFIVQVMYED